MTNKYCRHQSVISRNFDENIEEDHWFKQFQKNLVEKQAVQSKPIDNFLFDQINSIMNGKSKYPSVEAAVEDMKERSGLSAFLAKTSNEDNDSKLTQKKTASDNNDAFHKDVPIGKKLPVIIIKCPQVRSTIENIVKSTRGNLSIPAIIDKVRSIHQNDVSDAKDWESDDLLYFVSGENLKVKQQNPQNFESSNLGRIDNSNSEDIDAYNNNAFIGLMPTKF